MALQSDSDEENGNNSEIDPIEVAIDAGATLSKPASAREQATFLNFGGNFLIFEQLRSNFWV